MGKMARSRLVTGMTLILIGLGVFTMQYIGLTSAAMLFFAGGAMIAAYLYRRHYSLLVVGGIMTGIALGALVEGRQLISGDSSAFGLGIGFILIYVVELIRERRAHWWPLVPGAALLVSGFMTSTEIFRFLFSDKGWPLLVVIAGVIVLLSGLSKSRRGGERTE
ncbi:MAG: hypothetical protein GY716_17195 [bacterium]|nr:hypothetical protein [bacterium]